MSRLRPVLMGDDWQAWRRWGATDRETRANLHAAAEREHRNHDPRVKPLDPGEGIVEFPTGRPLRAMAHSPVPFAEHSEVAA